MGKQFRYDAFISYRHADLDKAVAKKLQKLLETYKAPKSVVSENFKHLKVFRDESELHTSSNLSDEIRKALEDSKFLIVICSEAAKESKWCMEEIKYFKSLHNCSNSNIIPLVVSGEPTEVFPDELCNEQRPVIKDDGSTVFENFAVEPLAANVASDNKNDSLKMLKTEFLRIAAAILECGYDSLYNREQKRKTRNIISVCAVVASLLAAFGLYTSFMLFKINAQKNIALENEAKAIEANKNLRIKSAEILSSQAEIYLNNDDVYLAADTALQSLEMLQDAGEDAPQGIIAQRIIADAVGAYSARDRMLCDTVNLSGYVDYIELSGDGRRIFAKDTNGILYVIDYENGKILKSYTPLDTFGQTSEYLKAVAVDGTYGYALCNGQIISINLEDGSVNWHYNDQKLYLCFDTIEVNEDSSFVVVPASSGSVVIDKISGSAKYIENKEERSYLSRTYLDSSGLFYCVDCAEKALYINDFSNGKELKISLDIPDGCRVLSMGEGKDHFYITFVTAEKNHQDASRDCGLVLSVAKTDWSVVWKTRFDAKYLSDYNFNKTLEHSHVLMDDYGEYYNVTGVVVVSGAAVFAFDVDTGESYFKTESNDGKEILYFNSEGTKLNVGYTDCFNYSTYIFKGTQYGNLSREDVLLYYEWYDYDSEYRYVSYAGDGRIAVAENKSPTIRIYRKEQGTPDAVLSEFPEKDYLSLKCITDNGNGILAMQYYKYDDNVKNNYIVIYDVNNDKLLSHSKITIDVKKLSFIDQKTLFAIDNDANAVIYDWQCNPIYNINVAELIGGNTGTPYVKSYNGMLYYCINDGIFEIDFLQNEPTFRAVENDKYLSDFFMNDGVISYLKNDYKNNTASINYIEEGNKRFVLSSGEKAQFLLDSVSLTVNSGSDCKIAFISKEGYIGIYSHGDQNFRKIIVPRSEAAPIKIVFTPDSRYIIALCSNGAIIKYSLDSLNEVGRYAVDFEISDSSELYFIDEITFAVRNYSGSDVLLVINCDSMELKAEVGDYVYSMNNDRKFICRYYNNNGYVYGYYKHHDVPELMELAKDFVGK